MEKEIVISTIENFLKEHNSQFSIFLNQREMAVLTLRQQGKTLQDIGDQLKVTRERVRQIEGTALKRQLRSKELAQKLYNSIKGYFFTDEELKQAFEEYLLKSEEEYSARKLKWLDFNKVLWEKKGKLSNV
jgi:DNA-binding CsgD family transcriptional regulator